MNIVTPVSHCLPSASFERRQENTLYDGVVSIFQYKRSVWNLFFEPSERNRRRFAIERLRALFLWLRNWNISQLRNYSNYHWRTVTKELRKRKKRSTKTVGGVSFFLFRRHTSDINSHESVTEAICRARRTGRRQL